MEIILKELETSYKTSPNSDYDGIDVVAYIAYLTEDTVNSNEVEIASKIIYYAVERTLKNSDEIFLRFLKENDEGGYLYLFKNDNKESYIVNVRSKWLFQVILLNSVKSLDILHLSNTNFIRLVVEYIVKYLFIEKHISIHLLRTLLLIISKRSDVLTTTLSLRVLNCMNRVALSPIPYFKQYAQNISKNIISTLPQKEKGMLLDIDMLPIRGIDTFEVVKLYPRAYIKENLRKIVGKVLKSFLYNVENKDGAILYNSVLFYSFDEWKVDVWPLFLSSLNSVDYECEFFQSLIKYWIPSNVSAYKSEFYSFLKSENIDHRIKTYVLLESKKRGFTDHIDFFADILPTFYNIDTSSMGLRIVSTYHKKSLYPENHEFSAVLDYLYSNLSTTLEEEELKSFRLFFSQIFLHSHASFKKDKGNLVYYSKFIQKVYKYCLATLRTNHFEVAAQILSVLQSISTGSYKNLKLNYKVEKRDMYEDGANLLYKELKANGLWRFDDEELREGLKNCFVRNNGNCVNLTRALATYTHDSVDVGGFKRILESEVSATLQNTDRIKSYAEILFKRQNYETEILDFLKQITTLLTDNLSLTLNDYSDERILYKNVVFLEILLAASKNKFLVEDLHDSVQKALEVVNCILENNSTSDSSYKAVKVTEAFVNSIMYCIVENKDALWISIDRNRVIDSLVKIIQRSNMKRPVSLSAEVLKQFGSKMEETESGKILKIQLLDETLKSVYKNPVKQDMKIRRSPESRLVIHALCSTEGTGNKPLLKWALTSLLDVVSDKQSSDSTVSSALHSIEILVSDNTLQTDTLPFIQDILKICVELFSKSSWIVRNASLQLAKALIERFYGVSLSLNNRPKNIEDFFLVFPQVSIYFFEILSREKLDERAVIVFQFFIESQIRVQIFQNEFTKAWRDIFLIQFMEIIKNYPNHYGKFAVRSYVALCMTKNIPRCVLDITDYIKSNFARMPKNIFASFSLLLQELYEKYNNSSDCNFHEISKINLAMNDLLSFLRKFDTPLFNFLLFKVKSVDSISKQFEFLSKNVETDFETRLWLHNNLPFLLINTKPKSMANILDKTLTNNLPSCFQIKILSILVVRFENTEFTTEDVSNILETLFEKSFTVDDNKNYLLNCYYKTILLFYKTGDLKPSRPLIPNKNSTNLYKLMIYVLYFSRQGYQHGDISIENFYKLILVEYIKWFGKNEELDNDIMCTLWHLQRNAPKKFRCAIFKLVFYYALFPSTHLEAFSFISRLTGKSYSGLLCALKDFLSVKTLLVHLEDVEIVKKFLLDITSFVNEMPDCSEDDGGYYTVESDYLVSKLFLKRLLKYTGDYT